MAQVSAIAPPNVKFETQTGRKTVDHSGSEPRSAEWQQADFVALKSGNVRNDRDFLTEGCFFRFVKVSMLTGGCLPNVLRQTADGRIHSVMPATILLSLVT